MELTEMEKIPVTGKCAKLTWENISIVCSQQAGLFDRLKADKGSIDKPDKQIITNGTEFIFTHTFPATIILLSFSILQN